MYDTRKELYKKVLSMNYEELANKLYFAKEAADYLGITPQRLSQLVHDGKIVPLKKSSSGTVFHIDELQKRKEELQIFDEYKKGGGSGMFLIDNEVKQEALNFATLMNVLNYTEQKLEPLFEEFSEKHDVTIPMTEKNIIQNYSTFFQIFNSEKIKRMYDFAAKEFSKLKADDEIIKRGFLDYPPLLSKTKQAPRFLYVRGRKALLQEKRTVALVGSRQASEEAKKNTERVAELLGRSGIIIVSGLAKGIDVTAHKSALEHHYNTIAVIGTNLNQYYPIENKEVQLEIEKKGLVVSQFSPATKTERWFFPLRNGVMSGLSLATVIMEAGETSGALKQADFAIKQGRQILIPSKALELKTITWPKKYVEQGAQVVTSPKDIIQKLAENHVFNGEREMETQLSFNSFLKEPMKREQNALSNTKYVELQAAKERVEHV